MGSVTGVSKRGNPIAETVPTIVPVTRQSRVTRAHSPREPTRSIEEVKIGKDLRETSMMSERRIAPQSLAQCASGLRPRHTVRVLQGASMVSSSYRTSLFGPVNYREQFAADFLDGVAKPRSRTTNVVEKLGHVQRLRFRLNRW